MKQSEIADSMRPAAKVALEKKLTCAQALRAFLLTLADEAMAIAGNQKNAARLLSVSDGQMSRIVNGKVTPGASTRAPGRPSHLASQGLTHSQAIGEIEL